MKKFALIVFLFGTINSFAQVSQGDIEIIQQYYGTEKMVLVKEYMEFNSQQDSVFWPIYEAYERERLDLGKQRFALIEDYLNNVEDISSEKASDLVEKSVALDMNFKKLQKQYFHKLSKKIGPVKAAQFYQFETYINNIINLSVQESIPFVGQLHQKYADQIKKRK